MAAPTVVWRHMTAYTDETGIYWDSINGGPGTHVISGGGFANIWSQANDSSTDQNGNDASGWVQLIGSFPEYTAELDMTVLHLGFAAPPGSLLRAHMFAILAGEA